MLDIWTDTLDSPGKRTTGTKAGNSTVVPQCWNGTLPEGVMRIDSPTPYIWIIGRTQTNGKSDYGAVHKIQDGYRITPLAPRGYFASLSTSALHVQHISVPSTMIGIRLASGFMPKGNNASDGPIIMNVRPCTKILSTRPSSAQPLADKSRLPGFSLHSCHLPKTGLRG